jgi:hypothetical protein
MKTRILPRYKTFLYRKKGETLAILENRFWKINDFIFDIENV